LGCLSDYSGRARHAPFGPCANAHRFYNSLRTSPFRETAKTARNRCRTTVLRAASSCRIRPASPSPIGTNSMADTPPDRLSNDPRSPFYDESLLARGIGIVFKGKERFD